jgi:hypothetical protein
LFDWGARNWLRRWGENVVTGTTLYQNPANSLLFANFDQNARANEAHLSEGDSGGAVFIREGNTWKLAGINFSVSGVYRQPGDTAQYTAALFDTRGYYNRNSQGQYVQITGANPVPTAFYATRVSAKLAWIYSVTDPTGDFDGDGLPNLMEYALNRNPLAADSAGATTVAREGDFLTLTFTRVTTATDIQYEVQKSEDLVTWTPAASQGQSISTSGNLQTVKASEPIGSTALFLRLSVKRP